MYFTHTQQNKVCNTERIMG